MTDPITVIDFDGGSSVNFDAGTHPADAAIRAAGHEPNGYFWEGLVQYAFPGAEALEMDSEADMFSATGDRAVLERLAPWLDALLADPDRVSALISQALADGVEFDD
ncbi:hypothetical protein DUY81_10935 [Acidipropionibacterium acidipropionici]|jgi:hypothetical protein|uniref:Immunity protein 51 of polymorphic toxin system n=2 Tax=Acidipropionibacterium acidipropionici TaxID=1748 RepID=A0AAC9AMP8_9ACTN|nr:Imm51 family immunity protein [Acidipropionibacterium acidipropionici]AFV89247.1 hypothetical protein PACID_14300 [Acidipropionibacterium acidipropionici ATCC 4875]AMS04255.1 hypothetical protein AXH35_00870 [Acidipropionibacterium acidipropionici]AOZ45747.1 hypothetical protein A8L58_02340 [Acidipropionibacterium acidipropionici]AZP38247.1 hypothetical protein DUY81_10935 [Acidipropionibacterium acidipropionici]MDN6557045.1 immunity 51 family protein [Acidipropionibacterium acidipropionici